MLPGTVEYNATIRYFEYGKMRRFETALLAHSFIGATTAAEKLLYSRHPSAAPMSIEIVHSERKKQSIPRLVITNDPKKV